MSLTTNIDNPVSKKYIPKAILVTIGILLTIVTSFLIRDGNSDFIWVICGCLAISFLLLRPEKLFCYWLAFFPIADYLLRYPEQQAIITFARVVVMMLAFGVVARLIKNEKISLNLGWFEISWALFAIYALGNCLLQASFSLSTLRTAVDGFILPLILFVIVRHCLNIRKISEKIFIGLIILAYVVLPIGIYELVTGIDLLVYPGGRLLFDGRIRPNGAFLSDHSYALISLILGLTLVYWPKVANIVIKYKMLWYGAIASAFLAALVPQFRAVMIVMIVCLALGQYLISGWRSLIKPVLIIMVLIMAGIPLWLVFSSTKFYQQRIADPTNFSSRVMTYKRALEVAQSNPMGVGLGNYENYFNQRWAVKERPEKEKLGQIAQSTPHSNFLSVVAELGIIGLILYLIAHLSLIYIAWQMTKHPGHTQIAGVAVILLVIAYAGVGFTLTSGYYYDLNLFFFCCLGILLGRGIVEA